MNSKVVKLYGIERSGTNWIQSLLELNTDAVVLTNTVGWKHGIIHDNGDHNFQSVNALVISKNPYHWYQSIMRYKGELGAKYWYQKYAMLYRDYLDFVPDDFFVKKEIIRYEDLLANPESIVADICKKFGLKMDDEFTNPKKVFMSKDFSKERKEMYLSSDYKLDADIINLINSIIPESLFNELNYIKL